MTGPWGKSVSPNSGGGEELHEGELKDSGAGLVLDYE